MSVNFGMYYKQLNKMGHFIGSTWSYKNMLPYNGTTLNYTPNSALAVTTQCNVVITFKYNSSTQLCELISSCNLATLNAKYCKEEATAVVCEDNYHYGNVFSFNL